MTLNLVPLPQSIKIREGCFTVDRDTRIMCDSPVKRVAGSLAAAMRPSTGFPLPVEAEASASEANTIGLRLIDGQEQQLGDEGYRLSVTPERVDITARTQEGLLYGVQTLLQMLPHLIVSQYRVPRMDPLPRDVVLPEGWRAPAWEIPCASIEDRPRFEWRGLMIDCSRHFMPVETLKWAMDKMLQLKMNRLHLHLSDNHGWRIEVPEWPKLTEIGSCVEPEPRRHGFYTATDIKTLVHYAGERNIVLVPEIDVPGHIFAAVKAYPELCCTGAPRRNDMSHWHQLDILCAGSDRVYEFLDDVFGALIDRFPGPYIHVGGDEAPKNRWRACPRCQERMRREKLAHEDELQAYLIGRISDTIRNAGRRVVAWDDVLAGHPNSDVIIHWWHGGRGMAAPVEGIRRGHQVICSRSEWNYYGGWRGESQLESFYRDAEYLPPEFGAFREHGPAVSGAPPEWANILGAQGCMWTESTPPEMLCARIFPAILANAELQWHYVPRGRRDWPAFSRRAMSMRSYFEGFDKLNWGS
jgi:hexosaminidase